jgi:hypothetical protein
MDFLELKEFLDFKANQYENPDILESDPLKLVHQLDKEIFYSYIVVNISFISLAMYTWLI